MAIGKDRAVGRQLRTLFDAGSVREWTDGQLLERFANAHDEAAGLAFAALVERHGAMVLRVCRGVLDDAHDAEDAFQATFLVLVARGRALWVRDSLGPWLHQVAYRTASSARAHAARRRRLERGAAREESAGRSEAVDDLGRVLLEEVDRLPERYRAPIVLCDLEGRTHEQAARHLGWPVGTIKSRQARARDRLRARLARRGLAPGAGLLMGLPRPDVPLALLNATTLACVRSVASRAIAPGTAAALAQGVIRAMTMTRWLKAATILAALGAAGSGVGLLAQDRDAKPGDGPKPEGVKQAAPVADPSVVEVKPGKFTFSLTERGVLEPSRARDVFCNAEGTSTIVAIKPDGARVSMGEIVAELDSAALRDALIGQQMVTQLAKNSYDEVRMVRTIAEFAAKRYREEILPREREASTGKIAEAESGIREGEARLDRTRRARQRFNDALGPNKEPATPADIAADLVIDAQLDDAVRVLAKQRRDFEGLSKQKRDLESARKELELAKQYLQGLASSRLSDYVEKATADELAELSPWGVEKIAAEARPVELVKLITYETEKGKERKLERRVESCTLRAPRDGLLIYANDPGRQGARDRVQIEEGATVRQMQKIFSVFDPSDPMRVNVRVGEPLVDRLEVGNTVRVKVDALPDEVLTGVVCAIASMPAATSLADQKKFYPTYVELDPHAALNLRPGLTASAEILIAELDGVLTVPASSIFIINDKQRVICKTPGGGVEWRDVTFGMSNSKVVEVKQGLRSGDLVVSDPKSQLTREMKDILGRIWPELGGRFP